MFPFLIASLFPYRKIIWDERRHRSAMALKKLAADIVSQQSAHNKGASRQRGSLAIISRLGLCPGRHSKFLTHMTRACAADRYRNKGTMARIMRRSPGRDAYDYPKNDCVSHEVPIRFFGD